MARRKRSLMDSGNATIFVLEMIHLETSALLRIADETCQRYPSATNLHFVRYLLRMIVLETEEEMKERRQ